MKCKKFSLRRQASRRKVNMFCEIMCHEKLSPVSVFLSAPFLSVMPCMSRVEQGFKTEVFTQTSPSFSFLSPNEQVQSIIGLLSHVSINVTCLTKNDSWQCNMCFAYVYNYITTTIIILSNFRCRKKYLLGLPLHLSFC